MAMKNPSVEVSSDQLFAELREIKAIEEEIKERVGALENVAGLVNQPAIESHVRATLKSSKRKEIMQECRAPQSKQDLIDKLGFKSTQALDYHLDPLREDSLLHVKHTEERMTFQWSALVKRLPKSRMDAILNDGSK